MPPVPGSLGGIAAALHYAFESSYDAERSQAVNRDRRKDIKEARSNETAESALDLMQVLARVCSDHPMHDPPQ